MKLHTITPCLRFDQEAEEAARHYCAIFPNSSILAVSRYGEAGYEHHYKPPGGVLTVVFALDGQTFTALNGGPPLEFNEVISFQVRCDSQAAVDRYWDALSAGGGPAGQQCGWLKDRFGVSWQVVPAVLPAMMTDPDAGKVDRVTAAILAMKRPDIAALTEAYDG